MAADKAIKKNIYRQKLKVNKEVRREVKGHNSAIIWFTGLPGSGKTTISNELEKTLHDIGVHTYLLDGDNVRHGLSKDLGFSRQDRDENIRRIGEVAKLFVDAGILVLCAFASPYREQRMLVRELVGQNEFVEVFVKCPIDVCIQRDPKGLYKKAIAGEIKCFTGIDDPYEEPEKPEIVLCTDRIPVEESIKTIISYLKGKGIVIG